MGLPKCSACTHRNSCILKHVEENELLQLGQRFALLTYDKGARVFNQGEPVAGCYIICQGIAKLYRRTREGNKQLLKLLDAGDFLACELLAGEHWYQASLETLGEVKVLFIGKDEFLALLAKHPAVAREVQQRLARDSLEIGRKLTRISYESDEKVLGKLLLELEARYGAPAGGGEDHRSGVDGGGTGGDGRGYARDDNTLSKGLERKGIGRASRSQAPNLGR